ncbi:hypothetical protein DVT68_00580 [Dyella solisilvae]|uniref:Uncharacterized protein n=1 Tax=Dyella solisilvae TaxID=1920168 RepID=A0A370K9R5_9GAMM|nr:hypothetical protein [Dyella solisilvae]RDI99394.1 hypothetical protein DVT68_00580 [Dyella solisilvae]
MLETVHSAADHVTIVVSMSIAAQHDASVIQDLAPGRPDAMPDFSLDIPSPGRVSPGAIAVDDESKACIWSAELQKGASILQKRFPRQSAASPRAWRPPAPRLERQGATPGQTPLHHCNGIKRCIYDI